MKLRYVFFLLQPEWEPERNRLIEELNKLGILCWIVSDSKALGETLHRENQINEKVNVQREKWKEAILVTDNREAALAYAEIMVCIGCDRDGFSFFEGAELVTDDLSALDGQILEETLLHAQGFPVTVAQTERLVIREIAEQDFDGLLEMSRRIDQEQAFWMCAEDGTIFERERLKAYVAQVYRFYGYGLWSVLKKDGTLIGCCGLSECEAGKYVENSGTKTAKDAETRDWKAKEEKAECKVGDWKAKEEKAECKTGDWKTKEEKAECKAGDWKAKEEETVCEMRDWKAKEEETVGYETRLEMQYMLAPQYQGQGYAQEMCRALLGYAFARTDWDKVWIRVHRDNEKSIRLAEKLGFSVFEDKNEEIVSYFVAFDAR